MHPPVHSLVQLRTAQRMILMKWSAAARLLEGKIAVQPLSFVVGRTFITIDDHLQGCKMTEDVTWLGRTNSKTCHIRNQQPGILTALTFSNVDDEYAPHSGFTGLCTT